MTLDDLYAREYHPKHYHCAHWAADAWEAITGENVRPQLLAVTDRVRRGVLGALKPIDRARSPCVVIMHRARSTPHVGIYLEGHIVHMTPTGVKGDDPARACTGFTRIRYYR
jgi:hypothetical protein